MAAQSTQSEWAGAGQFSLPGFDEFFLAQRLPESRQVIADVAAMSEKPLIIQFSGGRDSMSILGLVLEVTDNFVCCYMSSGMEFDDVIPFVEETCRQLEVPLLISYPNMYKGDIFERIKKFRSFPGMRTTWCSRDLKLRAQKKMLSRLFGKGTFYKIEGIRMFESVRRQVIYRPHAEYPVREDGEFKGSYEVFPIVRWTSGDVLKYLEMQGLPTTGLYKEFGVSGCYWCPFYQPDIYRRILRKHPDMYNRFIYWEEKLGMPSVAGYYYLRDLKREVLEGITAVPQVPAAAAIDELQEVRALVGFPNSVDGEEVPII